MTTFTGTSGVDTLAGFGGNDEFYGLAGDDTLYGGGGNDTFFGGLGADEMYGGDGIDTASYAQATAGVSVDMGGTNTGGEANGDTFSSIENLIGSAYDDTLKGDSGDNVIDGGAGNDVIWGGPGADTLNGEAGDDNFVGGSGDDHIYGGTGNDTLDGQAGNDTLEGGTGDDIYFIDNTFDVITENAAEGNDTVEVGWEASTYTLGAELENLTFSNVSTFGSFTGNAGDNVITMREPPPTYTALQATIRSTPGQEVVAVETMSTAATTTTRSMDRRIPTLCTAAPGTTSLSGPLLTVLVLMI